MSDNREIRVAVLDVWDGVPIAASGDTSINDVKLRALAAAQVTNSPASYLVKFRGAELRDETQTLATAGVPSGGALIVLPRRRRAVR